MRANWRQLRLGNPSGQRRVLLVEARGILVRFAESQQFGFAEGARVKRDAGGSAGVSESIDHIQRGIAGQVRHAEMTAHHAAVAAASTAAPAASPP